MIRTCTGEVWVRSTISVIDIEGILLVFCRMICRNIQCFKVVIIIFYFRSFHYFIAHTDKDTLYFFQCNGIRMTVSDADSFLPEVSHQSLPVSAFSVRIWSSNLCLGLFQFLFNRFSGLIYQLSYQPVCPPVLTSFIPFNTAVSSPFFPKERQTRTKSLNLPSSSDPSIWRIASSLICLKFFFHNSSPFSFLYHTKSGARFTPLGTKMLRVTTLFPEYSDS